MGISRTLSRLRHYGHISEAEYFQLMQMKRENKQFHKTIKDIKAEIRKGLDIIGTCEDYEQGYDNATKRDLMIIDKHMAESEE